MLAAPFYLSLILALGALEPNFSHRTSPMSILGGVPGWRGFAFNFGVAATGVLIATFAIGLRRQLPENWTAKAGFALLVIGGLGLIGAAVFHCNESCRNVLAEPDTVGRLHLIASFLAGMGTGLAPFFVWPAMRSSPAWRNFATPTLVVAILANLVGIAFWLTIFAGYRFPSIEGLVQRSGFVIILLWIFVIAARLWNLPR